MPSLGKQVNRFLAEFGDKDPRHPCPPCPGISWLAVVYYKYWGIASPPAPIHPLHHTTLATLYLTFFVINNESTTTTTTSTSHPQISRHVDPCRSSIHFLNRAHPHHPPPAADVSITHFSPTHQRLVLTTMSSVAGPRLSPPTHAYRHHPYAAPQAQSSSRPKWASTEREKLSPRDVMPPSPPRSRRDQSETPSVGLPLGMAFGANGGGKWWDEELVSPHIHSGVTLVHCADSTRSQLHLHHSARS